MLQTCSSAREALSFPPLLPLPLSQSLCPFQPLPCTQLRLRQAPMAMQRRLECMGSIPMKCMRCSPLWRAMPTQLQPLCPFLQQPLLQLQPLNKLPLQPRLQLQLWSLFLPLLLLLPPRRPQQYHDQGLAVLQCHR